MTLPCFDKALSLAEDDVMPDVWFNISHVAIGIGDLMLAYQALRVASSIDNSHAESYNNLGGKNLCLLYTLEAGIYK